MFSADHIMIAAGSKSTMFGGDFEGKELCMTSDDIFALEQLPKNMVVIGGGYIGVEMSNIMNAFGVKVTLLIKDLLLGR